MSNSELVQALLYHSTELAPTENEKQHTERLEVIKSTLRQRKGKGHDGWVWSLPGELANLCKLVLRKLLLTHRL
jgi:hypothetical protein